MPFGSVRAGVLGGGGAIPDSVVDNFEDSPAGVYGSLTDFYSGDTGAFSRNTNSPVFEGSYSLKGDSTGASFANIWSDEGDGLNYYPQRGDVIVLDMQLLAATAGGDFYFLSPAGDPKQNGYFIQIDADADDFVLYKRDGGSQTILQDNSPAVSDGTHYQITIDLSTGDDIVATLRDVDAGSDISTINVTDGTFDARGIGYGVTNQSTLEAVWDNVRVQ